MKQIKDYFIDKADEIAGGKTDWSPEVVKYVEFIIKTDWNVDLETFGKNLGKFAANDVKNKMLEAKTPLQELKE